MKSHPDVLHTRFAWHIEQPTSLRYRDEGRIRITRRFSYDPSSILAMPVICASDKVEGHDMMVPLWEPELIFIVPTGSPPASDVSSPALRRQLSLLMHDTGAPDMLQGRDRRRGLVA